MDTQILNEIHPAGYDEGIFSSNAIEQFLDFMETVQRYNGMFNLNIREVKKRIELIDQGDENTIAQAGGKLADIEDWLQIFNESGDKVKKNLDIYRKELEKEIRESVNDESITEEYKQIIRDKMSNPQWLSEKRELCTINPDLGLFGILRPKIIAEIATENRLTYTRNATKEIVVIQDSISAIRDVLSGAHNGGAGILLNLKLKAAETNWNNTMAFINEILSVKRYLIQDCSF